MFPAPVPPNADEYKFYWGAALLQSGTMYVAEVLQETVRYDLYEPNLEADLLEMGVDENGQEVPIPMCFGSVRHMIPQRTGNAGVNTYYYSGIAPATLSAYDDGVDITSNVGNNGDGTFTLSVQPVGTVTVSGRGENGEELSTVASYALNRLGVPNKSFAYITNYDVDCVVQSQVKAVDFLSNLTGYLNHVFWITDDTAIFVHRAKDTKDVTLDEFQVSEDPITYPHPIKKITSTWQENYPTEDSAGKRIETKDIEVSVESDRAVGEEKTITAYNIDEPVVKDRLQELLDSWQNTIIAASTPIDDVSFMAKYTLIDSVVSRRLSFVLTGVAYNFDAEYMKLQGPGIYEGT
jgi:hypothetical protein